MHHICQKLLKKFNPGLAASKAFRGEDGNYHYLYLSLDPKNEEDFSIGFKNCKELSFTESEYILDFVKDYNEAVEKQVVMLAYTLKIDTVKPLESLTKLPLNQVHVSSADLIHAAHTLDILKSEAKLSPEAVSLAPAPAPAPATSPAPASVSAPMFPTMLWPLPSNPNGEPFYPTNYRHAISDKEHKTNNRRLKLIQKSDGVIVMVYAKDLFANLKRGEYLFGGGSLSLHKRGQRVKEIKIKSEEQRAEKTRQILEALKDGWVC